MFEFTAPELMSVALFKTKFAAVVPKVAWLLFVTVPPEIAREVLPDIVPSLVTVPPSMSRFAFDRKEPGLSTVPVKIVQSDIEVNVPWFVRVRGLDPPPIFAVELEVMVPAFVKTVAPAPPPMVMLAAVTVAVPLELFRVADPRLPTTPLKAKAPVRLIVPVLFKVLPWIERLGGLIVPWLMSVPPDPVAPSNKFNVGEVEVMEELGPRVSVPALKRNEALCALPVGLKMMGALIVWLPP